MGEENQAERLVNAVISDFPDHEPGTRPVHTIGIGVKGHFVASEVARNYSVAAHFKGDSIPVTVRYSNGQGSPRQQDSRSDVRGMATRFHLPDGSATDLVAMTLGEFFCPTVESFLELSKDSQPVPPSREKPLQKLLDMMKLEVPMMDPYPGSTYDAQGGLLKFANRHRYSQLAIFQAGGIGAPTSYARAAYHAVHTFVLKDPEGVKRYVRFSWQPVAGVKNRSPEAPVDNDYLHEELRQRLQPGKPSTRFILRMVIGENGDALDDPTKPWPKERVKVMLGTLYLTEVAPDQETSCINIAFNPCRLTNGIELSDDPILRARQDAYEYSRELRGGTACPFSKGDEQ